MEILTKRAVLAAAVCVAGCAQLGPGVGTSGGDRTATIQRTAYGVAHIVAPDLETLAYGMAYAYAQDNVCMSADHLVTVRGERSRYFGDTAMGAFGLRRLGNAQIACSSPPRSTTRSWRVRPRPPARPPGRWSVATSLATTAFWPITRAPRRVAVCQPPAGASPGSSR